MYVSYPVNLKKIHSGTGNLDGVPTVENFIPYIDKIIITISRKKF